MSSCKVGMGVVRPLKKQDQKDSKTVDVMKDVLDDDEVEIRRRWGRFFESRGRFIDVEEDAIWR